MGRFTIKFSCISCGHCCRDVVCLPTPTDVIRLARETGVDPKKFLEFITPDEISEVSKSDPTWLYCNNNKYLMALRRTSSGCYFLNKRTLRCKVYEHRPMLCRLYPFALSEASDGKFKGFSLQRSVECPRQKNEIRDTWPLYKTYLEDERHQNAYEQLVWLFNGQNQKDPWEFCKLFI